MGIKMRHRFAVGCLLCGSLALTGVTGCKETPRAPALVNETVYRNESIGVTFLTPEGWNLYGKTTLPPGPLNRPIRLVSYSRVADKNHAEFELCAVEVRPDGDLIGYLNTNKIGAGTWNLKGTPAPETIKGAKATRYVMTDAKASSKMIREIVAFPRGERQFLFVFTHHESDTLSSDQVQKSIDSITWN